MATADTTNLFAAMDPDTAAKVQQALAAAWRTANSIEHRRETHIAMAVCLREFWDTHFAGDEELRTVHLMIEKIIDELLEMSSYTSPLIELENSGLPAPADLRCGAYAS